MRMKVWMAVTAVLLVSSAGMRAQTTSTVKDDLFAGTEKFAQNASSVTEVDMDPDSLGMVKGSNSTRARRTVLSVVHTYSYDKPGMYNMADVDAFRNKLNTGDWHCSVHVRELKSGESTDVCRKHRTDDLEETAIVTVEPKELTFIHTIRRPSTPGKPDGDSLFFMPGLMGLPGVNGMPSSAWAAEMRAHAAEMRAEAMIDRVEMGALPGVRMNLHDGGTLRLYGEPGLDPEQMRDLMRDLEHMPAIDLRRAPQPPAPTAPTPSAPPAVPQVRLAPQGALPAA